MLARVLTQFSFNNSPIILLFYDFVFLLIENNVANEIPNVNIHNINFVLETQNILPVIDSLVGNVYKIIIFIHFFMKYCMITYRHYIVSREVHCKNL